MRSISENVPSNETKWNHHEICQIHERLQRRNVSAKVTQKLKKEAVGKGQSAIEAPLRMGMKGIYLLFQECL